jgi:hypothetical protein
MSMTHYEQAVRLIEEHEGDFEGPKSEAFVAKAEAALDLVFPPTYRRFLRELGCGDIGGLEIYGIVDDDFVNSSVPDGIWLTLENRKVIRLNPAVIIISDVGDGTFYGIDTSERNAEGESPVRIYSVNGEYSEKEADDFGAFLLKEVREAVDDT